MTVYRANGANSEAEEAKSDADVGKDGENVGNVGENIGSVGEDVREKTEIDGDIKNTILRLIKADNKTSAASIAKTISVAQRTVERHIKDLREEGVLIRHGAARGGNWEVLKEEA